MCHVYALIEREKAGSSQAGIDLANSGADISEETAPRPKASAFAALGVDLADVGMEDEEDFGGLMVCS